MSISSKQKKVLQKLGQRIKTARTDRGLTLRELSYKIDKEPQSISRVEMGDVNPTFLYLLDICEGLDMHISDLLKD